MKLYDASLCLDCDEIVPSTDGQCRSCTNNKLFPLTRVIRPLNDRPEIDMTRTIKKAMEAD